MSGDDATDLKYDLRRTHQGPFLETLMTLSIGSRVVLGLAECNLHIWDFDEDNLYLIPLRGACRTFVLHCLVLELADHRRCGAGFGT